MAVYVDTLKNVPKEQQSKNWPYDKSCHLVADDLADLHLFAQKLGLKKSWFQNRIGLPHYDLTDKKREEAVKAGAIEITEAQIVDMIMENREKGNKTCGDCNGGGWLPIGFNGNTVAARCPCGAGTTPTRIDTCKNCGGAMIGDGYSLVFHCEFYGGDISSMEPDAEPIYCGFKESTIEICNMHNTAMSNSWDVRVDRITPLGNRTFVVHEKDRDMSCDKYAAWLEKKLNVECDQSVIQEFLRIKTIYENSGKLRLFCWCAPKRCHAETIKKYLEESGENMEHKQHRIVNQVRDATVKEDGITVDDKPVLAFDVETELIEYTNPIPDLICMSFADAGALKGSIATPWEHQIDHILGETFGKGQHAVGHSVSFDLSILAFKYPDFLPYIFDALDKGLIHDTLIREKLLMLTLYGNFDMIEINGANVRLGYKQTDLEKKYLNIDRSDLKNDEDAPRMNYHIYKNVPLEKWDENFISYSVDDSVNCGLIYQEQEIQRAKCIETTGYDPFAVEAFRVKVSFALRLLECIGERMDPAMILEVSERFRTEYAQPRLRNPLLAAGLLVEAVPPVPYAKKTLAHTEVCDARKGDKEHKKARKDKTCGCPVKMKAAVPEKSPQRPLFQYIWNLAHTNPNIEAWPSEGCTSDLRKAGIYDDVMDGKKIKQSVIASTDINKSADELLAAHRAATLDKNKAEIKKLDEKILFLNTCRKAGHTVLLPDDIKLATHEEWASTFAALDPILAIWAERKALRKIITDYLPKMYYTDEEGVERPANVIRASFYPLCLTGRSSSSASSLYPSRNGQNVDPRVRPCTIPRDGNIIISTDYSGMELGTLAQKCINLFGHSVMADNINAGIDNHAYLAAQIAAAMDNDFNNLLSIEFKVAETDRAKKYEIFAGLEDLKEPCGFPLFCEDFKTTYRREESKELDRPVMWPDFFEHYRRVAKTTGLGFPGGLGAATMVAFAKGMYKLELSLEVAKALREVWLETYPEMAQYLEWVNKKCKDPNHAPIIVVDDYGEEKTKHFYAYDTPRGMHRARCGYCEAANGAALQAFSAEGALEQLYRVQKATWLNDYEGELEDIVAFLDTVDPQRILSGSFLINFLHDENLWESPEDDKVGDRVTVVENIMVNAMQDITPNVKAGTDSVAMRRWYKKAKPVRDANNNLIAWEPEPEKKGI